MSVVTENTLTLVFHLKAVFDIILINEGTPELTGSAAWRP